MQLRTSLAPQPHLYMGDMQGRPLDAGKVYFGEPNKDPELYPIDVYYDDALTIAAVQPIRTTGGFMNASGQMVEIFAAEIEYSVKVLDGYGRQVFYQESMSSTSTSNSVSTKLPYLGAVIRTQEVVNSEKVSFTGMGAIGDGITDDTISVINTISNPAITEVDGLNKEYKITSAQLFNRGNLKIKNTTFLVTGLLQNQFAMEFTGSQNSDVQLIADANITDIEVANVSGFAVDDFVYISSNKEWSSAPFPKVLTGEIAQIKKIEGSKILLKGELCAFHKVADGAKVAKMNFLKNIKTENVKFINLDNDNKAEGGLKLTRCLSSVVDVESRNFQYAHVSVNRSAYTIVQKSNLSGCKALVGTNYGVVVADGCYVTLVKDSEGDDLRHFVTVGNTSAGGISRFVKMQNCHVTNMHDAYFDSHVGCAEFQIDSCSGSSSNTGAGQDGVMAQNAICRVNNSNFSGVGRHGIAYLPMVNEGVCRLALVLSTSNNELYAIESSSPAARDAVLVLTSEHAGREKVSLVSTDNDKSNGFDYHNFINAKKSSIDKVSISKPQTLKPTVIKGIEIRAQESQIGIVNINGGTVMTASAFDVIYLRGYSDVYQIKQWNVGAITLVGSGTNTGGVGATYTDKGYDSGIQVINCAKSFNITSSTKSFSSQTNITGSQDWAGGTIASGATVGFNVSIPDADFGDITRGALNVAAQGCDVTTKIDAAGVVRATIVNNSGSSRTFGSLKIKVALNKNI